MNYITFLVRTGWISYLLDFVFFIPNLKTWNTRCHHVIIWHSHSFGMVIKIAGLFSVGYFPIENLLKDISLSDKCPSEFLPIMDFYPLCFAHQEKTLPGLIPITILPIYLWIFTYHIFAHHRKPIRPELTESAKL